MTRVQLALDNGKATSDSVIDFLYALSPSQWKDLASMDQFQGFADTINTTRLLRFPKCRISVD